MGSSRIIYGLDHLTLMSTENEENQVPREASAAEHAVEQLEEDDEASSNAEIEEAAEQPAPIQYSQ